MKRYDWLYIGIKILGLSLFTPIFHRTSEISFFFFLSQSDLDARSPVLVMVPYIFQFLMHVFFLFIFLFRTEKVLAIIGVKPSEQVDAAPAPDKKQFLMVCMQLLAIYFLVQALPDLIRNIWSKVQAVQHNEDIIFQQNIDLITPLLSVILAAILLFNAKDLAAYLLKKDNQTNSA